MSHHRPTKFKYEALDDDDHSPRNSTSSDSPILPKRDVQEFEEDDSALTDGITFDTAGLETFYEPVDGYEGAHRYDPQYRWTKKDEQLVVRKVRLGRLSSYPSR